MIPLRQVIFHIVYKTTNVIPNGKATKIRIYINFSLSEQVMLEFNGILPNYLYWVRKKVGFPENLSPLFIRITMYYRLKCCYELSITIQSESFRELKIANITLDRLIVCGSIGKVLIWLRMSFCWSLIFCRSNLEPNFYRWCALNCFKWFQTK